MKKVIISVIFLAIFTTGLWAGGKPDLPLLLNGEELQEALESRELTLVDFGRSEEDYRKGHIEGAVYLPKESIWTKVGDIPGMFPGVEEVTKAFEEIGISRDKTVVIYDGIGNLWASRLFWTLEYLGHDDVHLLDGGIQGWESQGFSLSTEKASIEKSEFKADVKEELLAGITQILDGLAGEASVIVDTRSKGEYEGTDVRSANGGHIPGAIHVEWVNNVHSEERYFLSDSELFELYDLNGVGKEDFVVTLCQTGVRGAHTYFVLRNLGYENVALYDGSWAEWGNAEDVPIATGGQ